MSLFGEELVTRTKFIVPAARRAQLDRERLYARLDEVNEAALGLVIAGTGYGKSSLLSGFLHHRGTPVLWYELTESDADPQLFAIHLAHLVHRHYPGAADRALEWLSKPGGAERHGELAVDALADALLDRLEGDAWLVFDDFQMLTGSRAVGLVDRLIRSRPPRLHVVIASREKPELPDLPRWKLHGEVVSLDQAELAFTPGELSHWLIDGQGLELTPAVLAEVARETEGWPIALALVARRLRERSAADALAPGALTRTDLFEYLAREVLARLEPETRAFLLAIAPFPRLSPALCEAVTGSADAGAVLRDLDERGLFLIAQPGGSYRLHHLFRAFLLSRLAEEGGLFAAHRAAGAAMLAMGDAEPAVEQWLAAGDLEAAAGVMVLVAPALVGQSRYGQLESWIEALPAELVSRAPALAVCQGDACRLTGRFAQALGWYDRALVGYGAAPEGRSRALAGQALVYLDTLEPRQATQLLEEAIALAPAERRPELLVLLAENKLNHGDVAGAKALFPDANKRQDATEHEARLRLRTGRLADARVILRGALGHAETGTRAHREPALVLALIEVLEGDGVAAEALARDVAKRARARDSAWTEAVASIRLGHALWVQGAVDAAETAYREALTAAGGVKRLAAEPLLGLARVAGRRGDLMAARAATEAALEGTRATGDAWVSAMLALALGQVYAAAGDARATESLDAAQRDYEACGDAFGLALVAIGRARLALASNAPGAAESCRTAIAHARDHAAVLARPTLLGFEDASAVRGFFVSALAAGVAASELEPWLSAVGIVTPERPLLERVVPPTRRPGTAPLSPRQEEAMAVHVLGGFMVERDGQPLAERAWGREKARQLFQLLVVFRGQRLAKPRLVDMLWPDLDPASADGTFRVALNALNKALEPDRPGKQPTRFVVRDGATYGLGAEVWVDATAFERLLDRARGLPDAEAAPLLREALALYAGPFLPDADHEEAVAERERLAGRYTDGAIRLARAFARLGDDAGCAEWAQRLIARDPCCEEAYRLLMLAQYRAGDRGLAIRTYDRCVVTLSDELDLDPMPETQTLYEAISNAQPVAL